MNAQQELISGVGSQSQTLGALAAALAKAQGEMSAASKDKVNPHFRSKYADLASVWDACRDPLSKNGLAVVQRVFSAIGGVGVRTTLIHASGEWMQDEIVVPVSKQDAQGLGSAITYGRRYALAAMVGIAPDEDDDGNAAGVSGQASGQRRAPQQQSPKETVDQSGVAAAKAKVAAKTGRVIDVAPGETEEQAEAKAAADAPAPPAWHTMVAFGGRYNLTAKEVGAYLKECFPKKQKIGELTEGDALIVCAAIRNKLGQPPPEPPSDDIPPPEAQ